MNNKEFQLWIKNQLYVGNLYISKINTITGKWRKKYKSKLRSASMNNLKVYLTFEEYLYKAYEAGLTCPTQIGTSSLSYQLSRYKDIGNYTTDTCRFITRQENIEERNEHFNVSLHIKKVNAKRINNGTHHFLDSDFQKREQMKLVKKGLHKWQNIPPWKNQSATNNSLEVWRNANKCYEWWSHKQEKSGCISMCNKFSFKSKKACGNLIKKFKNGWIPIEDEEWLNWKKG